jgi:hypothetical protein
MTSPPADQPGSITALTIQVTALRGQVRQINARLDQAGLTGEPNLAARFEELAQTVRDALSQAPAGPPAPYWIGLDENICTAQLTELRDWVTTVLRTQYGGYDLRDCWHQHPHAIWELSTLAAEWHRTYSRPRPDLARALDFYDRWLPGTMHRLAAITARCAAQCITTQHRRV